MAAPLTAEARAWMIHGACRGQYTDISWFPEAGESTVAAKRVCNTICTVRIECLDYALTYHENFGIWGGTSYRDRRQMKRKVRDAVVSR